MSSDYKIKVPFLVLIISYIEFRRSNVKQDNLANILLIDIPKILRTNIHIFTNTGLHCHSIQSSPQGSDFNKKKKNP